jgi:RNA polymerase sigma-70 factor (ECF subfamily)
VEKVIFQKKRDQDLVRQFRKGDEQAFTKLVERYKKKIYLTAYRFVQNHEDADDLSQEAFIKAYQFRHKFRGDSSFYTWVYRIVVNLSINFVRREHRSRGISIEEVKSSITEPRSTPEKDYRNRRIRERLYEGISHLPPKQRLVFMLRQFDGLSHSEIAEMLNKSEGAVKANYFHAVHKLQRYLQEFLII